MPLQPAPPATPSAPFASGDGLGIDSSKEVGTDGDEDREGDRATGMVWCTTGDTSDTAAGTGRESAW
jgi:hypothetical protein